MSINRLAIYHYVTKSLEDFQAKMSRGGGAGIKRSLDYFLAIQQAAMYGSQSNQASKHSHGALSMHLCMGTIRSRDKFCPSWKVTEVTPTRTDL
eukprot:gene25182-10819_t